MTVSKLERKAKPTNGDLQDQVFEVHDCLNNLGGQVEEQGKTLSTHGELLVALSDAMGVRLPTEQELARGGEAKRIGRRVGGLSPWQAASYGVATVVSGLSAVKVLEPALDAAALTIRHFLIGH